MTVTDEMLIAYVDGELAAADAARVEAAIVADAALAERAARARRLRNRIADHYAPVAETPVPERFREMLSPPAEIVDFAAAREKRARRFSLTGWGGGAAVAASLAVGLIAGQTLKPGGGIVAERHGGLVAEGRLGRALDMQLASQQSPDAAVRIGLTFRGEGGDWCRTFQAAAVQGIACRGAGEWALRYAASRVRQDAPYRQAASGDINRAAQAMMRAAPVDADAERRARDSGWE